jgi:hypothetical protein
MVLAVQMNGRRHSAANLMAELIAFVFGIFSALAQRGDQGVVRSCLRHQFLIQPLQLGDFVIAQLDVFFQQIPGFIQREVRQKHLSALSLKAVIVPVREAVDFEIFL